MPAARPRVPTPVARLLPLAATMALLHVGPAWALVRPAPDPLGERVIPRPPLTSLPVDVGADPGHPAGPDADRFRARNRGPWRLTFDGRRGRLLLASGAGIPFLPGQGNSLPAAPGLPELSQVEGLAREVIRRQEALLEPGRGELVLNPVRSGRFDDGRLWFVDFDWVVDGVPVEGARVFLRVNHGNIVQLGTSAIGPGVPSAIPTLAASEALERAFLHAGGRAEVDRVLQPGRLLFVPRPLPDPAWGKGIEYRLVWRVAFRRGDGHAVWTADVDARTGEVLAFEDQARYARVTGGVYPRTVVDPEVERPMPFARVVQDGAVVDADAAGRWAWSGAPVFTALDGPYFRPVCDGCQEPEEAFAFSDRGTGDLRLGVGGLEEIGNGTSTRAERNAYYHLSGARLLARKWLSVPWLNSRVTANVNIADVCNAFWDGVSVNFFRSGSGCNNTGEIADVMYHEWGHGLDGNTLGGDFSTGEGTADIVAMHLTHDSLIGPHFGVGGGAVRQNDSSLVGYVARESDLGVTFCFVCQPGQCTNGPRGHEVHCEGEIYGQTHWDLAQALVAKHGPNTGWQESERLFFLAMLQTGSQYANLAGPAYDALIAVDDDNGSLADGTPNCDEIFAAFDAHEIAGDYCGGSSAGCTRPPQPVVIAAPGASSITLDWTATPPATSYRLLRSGTGPGGPFLPLGTTVGTQMVDDSVHAGLVYHYVVESSAPDGCRSTIEGAIAASPLPAHGFDAGPVGADDLPAGNRSGFPDPGEAVDLTVPVTNHPPTADASAVQGTLTTATPGFTPLVDSAGYGAIDAGSASTGSAYRIDIDETVTCGTTALLDLTLDGGDGAPATAATFPLTVGEPVTRFFDDFDPGGAWSLGTGTATSGLWDIDNPTGTPWQPEFDAGDVGADACLFTGQNTSTTAGDVDGGDTVVLSPIIDLSGATAARLSYRRWWAAASTGDAADSFQTDVSDDGGTSWVNVETLGAAERALGWTPVSVAIEDLVPLTDQFRVRFRAIDGGAESTVEAAVDDVRVDEMVCDLTPPCFIEPTFAGAASATPGASCAEIDLDWGGASSNCTNAEISFSVYRSTDPGFVPGPSTLVAQGLPGPSFHDTLLAPGLTYHYVVRAHDSRSGEDSNLAVVSAVSPAGADTVFPAFEGLASAISGTSCGEIALGWPAAQETCSGPVRYDVHRSATPGFLPDGTNRIASTLSAGLIDTALLPDGTYYYVVRAVDTAGNVDPNLVEIGAAARVLPRILYEEDFEPSDGGWGTIAPNNPATGAWEWGDPEGTGVQPEDDATPPPGVNAWITGLPALGGLGGNDIDAGVTTVASPVLDLSPAVAPVLEMALSFSNDAGAAPGEDPFQVHVSDDAGATWNPALVTLASIPYWTTQQFPLAGLITPNDQFRIRVTAEDTGNGSLVEAGFDDVRIFEPGAGCSGCPLPVPEVGSIDVQRSGDDVIVDWSADPVLATAYNVYLLSGPSFVDAVRAGSTAADSFVHPGAISLGESFFYRVTAVDACGSESALP